MFSSFRLLYAGCKKQVHKLLTTLPYFSQLAFEVLSSV